MADQDALHGPLPDDPTAAQLDSVLDRTAAAIQASLVAALDGLGSVDTSHVHVSVDNEVNVRIEGTVRDWKERAAVVRAVRSTGGVDWIDNRLTVERNGGR